MRRRIRPSTPRRRFRFEVSDEITADAIARSGRTVRHRGDSWAELIKFRKVTEYRNASPSGMLCSQSQRASPSRI